MKKDTVYHDSVHKATQYSMCHMFRQNMAVIKYIKSRNIFEKDFIFSLKIMLELFLLQNILSFAVPDDKHIGRNKIYIIYIILYTNITYLFIYLLIYLLT